MDDPEEDEMLEFEKVLGSGSFGTVYLIKDRLNRRYAVKRINFTGQQSDKIAAKREADLLSIVRHDNILNYIESFEDEECLNIVTEYCDGGDLDDYLKKRHGRKLPETRVCHWIYQLAGGLQYLHKQKILHRDLKTKNIFLMRDLSLKLGDLGIAKLLELNQTKADSFVGTPAYMSPELFKHLPYNHKTDVWSFGCCAYEMVGLQKAFGNDGLFILCKKVCSSERPSIPDCYNQKLKSLIYSMLHESPESRPSASDILINPFIVKRLSVPIDKSKSPDRTTSVRTREKPSSSSSRTQVPSARERRRQKSQLQRSKTFSSSWKEVKHQIDADKKDSHQRSVSKTMQQMKNLKIGSRRPGSGSAESVSSYSNEDDDESMTFTDNDKTFSNEKVIRHVENVNHLRDMSLTRRLDEKDGVESTEDDLEDGTFIRRSTAEIDPQVIQVYNNLPQDPTVAAKFMVQQMTDKLMTFESQDTSKRKTDDSKVQDYSKKNGQARPRKKKKILSQIAEKRRHGSASSDAGIETLESNNQERQGTVSVSNIHPRLLTEEDTEFNKRKKKEEVTLFTHGQHVRFSKADLDNDYKEDTAIGGQTSNHYVPFEKRKTTESVKNIIALVGSPENRSMCTDLISEIQGELVREIGTEDLQKCYGVMDTIQDDKIVKALLIEIIGQKKYDLYKEQLFYLRMLERSLQVQD